VKLSYDFKIELYTSANQLVNTYDQTLLSNLSRQPFEPSASDGFGYYCTSNLGGSGSDITAVSVPGTTLNNVAARNLNTSYTAFTATGANTGTLTWAGMNTINVTTSNNDIVSMWIDYDHNNSFDTGEWTLVTAASGARVASATFYIPSTALLGQARMRIRTRAAGTVNYSANACTNFTSGSTEDYTINIDRTSASSEIEVNVLKVYPNPAQNNITIEVPNFSTGTVSIVDLIGRNVQTLAISSNRFTHNVSDLKAGIYFITFKSDQGQTITKQFIKK
jgi:GEVED domain/Secretion system C-terminal sorting domain